MLRIFWVVCVVWISSWFALVQAVVILIKRKYIKLNKSSALTLDAQFGSCLPGIVSFLINPDYPRNVKIKHELF